MSIVTPAERGEAWAPKGPCLTCGEEIPADRPAVMWAGAQDVILHAECARKLGVHLICDSREAELAGGGHWWKRTLRALKSALVIQENRR